MDDVPVFPVIILAGLTVFGLAFLGSQGVSGDFGFGDSEKRSEVKFLSRDLGKVGSANQDFRSISFGDITVGETRGDVQAFRSRKEEISNSLFSRDRIVIKYNATQPKSGKISFEVLGRDGSGAVYAKANGIKVFEQHLIATGTPEINIPARTLKPGINKIVIGTRKGGIISSTKYGIEDVEVTVNDRKFHDYRDSFQMYSYELQDFVAADLTFDIRSSIKTEPLQVYVNDETVYSKRQVRISPEEVNITPRNADLSPGYNSIRFETDGDAKYQLENTAMTVRYIGNTEAGNKVVQFEADPSMIRFAEREDTKETISFEYQRLLPSPRPMVVELNGEKKKLNPENGENTIEFSADNLIESNVLEIHSNTTYQLNRLEVKSEKVEE